MLCTAIGVYRDYVYKGMLFCIILAVTVRGDQISGQKRYYVTPEWS